MASHRLLLTLGTSALLVAGIVTAVVTHPAAKVAVAPPRVRGTVIAMDDASITVKNRDGRTFTLKTGPDTKYADVLPSSLDAIKVGDFIGTASKGPLHHWTAVELMIIPQSLQAGRDGYAAWDPLPDSSSDQSPGMTDTTMTNGSVSDVSPAATNLTDTTTTNATVEASNGGAGGRTLLVTLVGNMPAQIYVPPTAPIVRLVRADRSTISVGSIVFEKTDPGNRADLICVGKGVIPPM